MTPALPLDDAGPYVAAAYLVFVALLLIYLAIMARKLARIGREITEVGELLERREAARSSAPGSAPARASSPPTDNAGEAVRP